MLFFIFSEFLLQISRYLYFVSGLGLTEEPFWKISGLAFSGLRKKNGGLANSGLKKIFGMPSSDSQ